MHFQISFNAIYNIFPQERNIQNCLNGPDDTKKPKSGLLETFTVQKPTKCSLKDHSNLEAKLDEVLKRKRGLEEEVVQLKESALGVHETKRCLEKNVTTIRRQKSDLEKRLKEAEKDLSKLQSKSKKERLVSLGRDKIGRKTSESGVNTSTVSLPSHHNKAEDKEIEVALAQILEERQALRIREEEIKLREEAIREKEMIEKELEKLKGKQVRASQVMSKDLLRMSMKLQNLEGEISEKVESRTRTQTLSTSVNLDKEIRELREKREEISKRVDRLHKKMTSGEMLTGEEGVRFRELGEALEVTDAAIEYRSGSDRGQIGEDGDRAAYLPTSEVNFIKFRNNRIENMCCIIIVPTITA